MRVSATTVESFRLYMEPEQEWMTEEDLLATIRGEFHSTPAIELGRAFGRVLERPDKYRVRHGYLCDGYNFSDETMREPLALMDHRRGVFEAKASKDYRGVTVVSKADQIVGSVLYEHKTSDTFDVEKYLGSYQWRFMVDAFDPLMVTYHVFKLDDHGNSVVEVKGIESFNVFPYPECHRDCEALVEQFVDYARARGLVDLLRARSRFAGLEAAVRA